jgi:hypothetical protein
MIHTDVTPAEQADCLAIRELVDAYAHCADRRNAEGQGQSTIQLDGDRATGESNCVAHHLYTEKGARTMMVAWLRYLDVFVKVDGAWLFAERELYVDWTETRPSPAP